MADPSEADIQRYITWYEQMIVTYRKLSEAEKEHLGDWYIANRARLGLADWPGWVRYIGSPPWQDR